MKNGFANILSHVRIHYLNSMPKFSLLKTSFSWNFKNWFFCNIFYKVAISAIQNVEKTENGSNKEIKSLVLHPESLNSHNFVFSDNFPPKCLRICEIQRNIHVARGCLNPLIFAGKSNCLKIRIWSKSLGIVLLRTIRFIELTWRPNS